MSSSLRPVSVVDSAGERTQVRNLIGMDESGNQLSGDGHYVVVSVRNHRKHDIELVRALIENDLRPFEHKSVSLVRYGHIDSTERANRVETFLSDLASLPVTWSAVVCSDLSDSGMRAAATSVSAKKSITNGLTEDGMTPADGATALLHDGAPDGYSDYLDSLRKQAGSEFGPSFQRNLCRVNLTFLRDADRTYPQSNAADYIAGYIRKKLDTGTVPSDLGFSQIVMFDNSWIRPAKQPVPLYRLGELEPIREAELKSRVLSWLTGRGIPPSPTPTGRDPYRTLVERIEDSVVRDYLLNEL